MSIGRSTGLLFLFVSSSILISAEGAENCEIELIQGCISNYKGILRGTPSPDKHCSRVQVNQLNLRRACWKFFVCLWINLPLDVVYKLPFKLVNKVFTVGLLLDRVAAFSVILLTLFFLVTPITSDWYKTDICKFQLYQIQIAHM